MPSYVLQGFQNIVGFREIINDSEHTDAGIVLGLEVEVADIPAMEFEISTKLSGFLPRPFYHHRRGIDASDPVPSACQKDGMPTRATANIQNIFNGLWRIGLENLLYKVAFFSIILIAVKDIVVLAIGPEYLLHFELPFSFELLQQSLLLFTPYFNPFPQF